LFAVPHLWRRFSRPLLGAAQPLLSDYFHQLPRPYRGQLIPHRLSESSSHSPSHSAEMKTVVLNFHCATAKYPPPCLAIFGPPGQERMQYPHNRHIQNTVPSPHFPMRLPRVELEIVQGQAKHKIRPVHQRTYLFGNSDQCDLVLRDDRVEEIQGYILNTPEGVWVRQLGHQDALSVNGRQVRCMLLMDKDRLSVGPFELRVHIRNADDRELVQQRQRVPASQLAESHSATPTRIDPRVRADEQQQSTVPRPKFLRRATAVSRGAQHTAVAPPSWRHLSHDIVDGSNH